MHSIYSNLVILRRKLTFHNARLINLIPDYKYSYSIFSLRYLFIKLFVNSNILFFNSLYQLITSLFLKIKMSILNIIFIISIKSCCFHAIICHKHSGNKSYYDCHYGKESKIFFPFTSDFSWNSSC